MEPIILKSSRVTCTLYHGDCIEQMRRLPDNSVHCCVTSPPYWGLRRYLPEGHEDKHLECGLEDTPEAYVARMVEVFREVRRVLRDDGTCWINLGSSYAGSWGNYGGQNRGKGTQRAIEKGSQVDNRAYDGTASMKPPTASFGGSDASRSPLLWRAPACGTDGTSPKSPPLVVRTQGKESFFSACGRSDCKGVGKCGLCWCSLAIPSLNVKAKDLVSIPQLVAFALQADGWWLRQDIIWAKPNPMPESVTDRCTKAHEYVFLLTKSTRYFYDAEAVKEANTEGSIKRFQKNQQISVKNRKHESDLSCAKNRAAKAKAFDQWLPNGRNRRSVWSISTKPYRGAHFATFPPDLVEPCILAGTSEEGCCPACGTPWERVVEKTDVPDTSAKGSRFDAGKTGSRDGGDRTQAGERYTNRTTGWRPACTCGGSPVPCTVLEPFSGSGTTLAVAANLGRNAIGTELNEEYIGLAVERIRRELEQGLLF